MTAYILCSAMMAAGFGTNVDIACDHAEVLLTTARDYQIDPLVLAAVIQVESHWNPRARSHAGACGLTQVLPRFTSPRVSCRTLRRHPRIAIVQGARALHSWMTRRGASDNPDRQLQQGLCGYNAGNICFNSRRSWNSPGRSYARRVLRLVDDLRRAMETIRTLDTSPASDPEGTSLEDWYIMEGCGL